VVGCFVHSTLVPLATGTRLTWRSDLDLRAVFHKHMPLAVRAAQRLLEVDLLTARPAGACGGPERAFCGPRKELCTMSSATLIRWSGLAAMCGGVCMILFILIHPFGELNPPQAMSVGWVLANSFRVVGSICVLFGLVGLYACQTITTGRLGLFGFILAFIGTAMFVGNSMIIAYVLPPLAVHAPELASFDGPLAKEPVFALPYVLMIGILLLGYLLFGVSIIRAGQLPRPAAALLMLGALLFFAPPVVVPYVIPFVGGLLFGGALVWLGYALWVKRPERTQPGEWAIDGIRLG
jgi:hypothetical protein